ncbi:MAG TPA: hypothetical protein VK912_11350 [Longimicrobiales bacterium]|nr:hypothetical protein [Longimicrobiales bacterium]
MGRLIAGVLLGYLVMGFAVFTALSLAFMGLGSDRAFRPGVYDVSALWVVVSFVVGFGAALLGGWVARRIARTPSGPLVLAVVVAALGVAMAVLTLLGEAADPGLRTGAVGTFEAMSYAQTPIWIMFVNPLVGAVGVLLGGGILSTGSANVQTDPSSGANVH